MATISQPPWKPGDVSGGYEYGVLANYGIGLTTFDMNGNVLHNLLFDDACTSVFIKDDFAYSAKIECGFEIVNCQNPSAMVSVAEYDIIGEPNKVVVHNNIAYVANQTAGLTVVDVSNPAYPVRIVDIPTERWVKDVILSPNEQYLYAAEWVEGIKVFDLDNPYYPELINTVPTAPDSGAHCFAISEGYLYLAFYPGGLQVYDISVQNGPELLESFDTPIYFREIAISEDGDVLYACAETNGLLIYTIDSPGDLSYAYTYTILERPYDIAINGDYAYVADWQNGMYVLNISNYVYLFKTDSLIAQDAISGVEVMNDTLLAMCDWTEGVAVVNIANPYNVSIVDRIDNSAYAWGTFFDGNFLYLADCYDFVIYDVMGNVLLPPGLVTTSIINNMNIKLTWRSSPNADYYSVYRHTQPYFTPPGTGVLMASGLIDTTWTNVGAVSMGKYFYRVIASNSGY